MATNPSLSLGTLNVRGLAAKRKQSQVYRLLVDHDLDVLAVQETKVDGEEETGSMVQRFTYNYYTVVSHALGTSAGCVLFVRKLPGLVIDGYFSCTSGRLVFCDFSYCNVQWRVFCIYAPNTVQERANFFLSLKHHLHVQK